MKLQLPRASLRAALHLAAKNDVRYYLNGALLEVRPNDCRIVASNGQALACFRVAEEGHGGPSSENASFTIPRDVLETIAAKNVLPVVFESLADGRCQIDDLGAVRIFKPVEGQFPDYRRVIPPHARVDPRPAQFNVSYFAAFAKVAKELGVKHPETSIRVAHGNFIEHRSEKDGGPVTRDGSALIGIEGRPEFIGVLMPLRDETCSVPTGAPRWVHE
jgi:DNA polymerase III subunit beta